MFLTPVELEPLANPLMFGVDCLIVGATEEAVVDVPLLEV